MNILQVNHSDLSGGAARAAYRIHRSLLESPKAHHLQSQLRVICKQSDDLTVIGGGFPQGRLWRTIYPRLARISRRGFRTDNSVLHSFAWPSSGLGKELAQRFQRSEIDLVHLHWIGFSTISIEEIGKLPMPIVWTLHDQWAFCGAEHYTGLVDDKRFVRSYDPSSRPSYESGPDLNRRTWLRKYRCWRSPMHIVSPSTWLADCARRSSLMAKWPITVIPNPIDPRIWSPVDKRYARYLLHLPQDVPLVLFGAMGGTSDPRKGADLLFDALQRLRNQVVGTPLASLELLVFGQGNSSRTSELGFPIHFLGNLYDDLTLRLVYAAADVFVIPSRQDNLPNTGLEAHSCGTPVVAFRCGGLVDIVDDRITGALAVPFDTTSLATAICWVLENSQRSRHLGDAARERSQRLWDPTRIAKMYYDVYCAALCCA